eukprot:TRINITY_DN65989_c0_g1_i1.p1 TRINITY_DN65989_c0_g1~~TRINITY_DN65989_c0_g1_i1.p1  ORF type:complete len:265 (-),score=40.73 TRINITY_DN65989_c0_g1_i1:99-812(-)
MIFALAVGDVSLKTLSGDGGKARSRSNLLRSCSLSALLFSGLLCLGLLRYGQEVPSDISQQLPSGTPVRRLRGLGGLAETLRHAVKSEVEVLVREIVGEFGFSKEALFGDKDGRTIYEDLRADDAKYMRDLKDTLQNRTGARNFLIAKSDSRVDVEDVVAQLTMRLSGALNIEYVVVAFNGGGVLDRRGKPGGHRNWSFRGFYAKDGMFATFLDAKQVEELDNKDAVQDSCEFSLDA